jgi:hypothetical protein
MLASSAAEGGEPLITEPSAQRTLSGEGARYHLKSRQRRLADFMTLAKDYIV